MVMDALVKTYNEQQSAATQAPGVRTTRGAK
jgi:hypothetical protein